MRRVIADFAAIEAIVLAILPEATVVFALTDGAIFLTVAVFLGALASDATVPFSHGSNVTPKEGGRKVESVRRRMPR